VQAIIGAAATGMTMAVIDNVTSAGVVQCSPSNTGIGLTTYPDNGYYFRTAPSDVLQAPVLADLVVNAGYTNVAVVARADDYGVPFLEETVGPRGAWRHRRPPGGVRPGGRHVRLRRRRDGRLGRGRARHDQLRRGCADRPGPARRRRRTDEIFGADGIAGAAFADNFPSADVLEGMRFTAPTAIVPPDFEARLLAFNPDLVDFLFAPTPTTART
jgi:branched-chain amino acid transport system substrate-binding protein